MGRHRYLMPPSWFPMQDRDAATAGSKLLCGVGTLLQNSPLLWPEMVGSRNTLCN